MRHIVAAAPFGGLLHLVPLTELHLLYIVVRQKVAAAPCGRLGVLHLVVADLGTYYI